MLRKVLPLMLLGGFVQAGFAPQEHLERRDCQPLVASSQSSVASDPERGDTSQRSSSSCLSRWSKLSKKQKCALGGAVVAVATGAVVVTSLWAREKDTEEVTDVTSTPENVLWEVVSQNLTWENVTGWTASSTEPWSTSSPVDLADNEGLTASDITVPSAAGQELSCQDELVSELPYSWGPGNPLYDAIAGLFHNGLHQLNQSWFVRVSGQWAQDNAVWIRDQLCRDKNDSVLVDTFRNVFKASLSETKDWIQELAGERYERIFHCENMSEQGVKVLSKMLYLVWEQVDPDRVSGIEGFLGTALRKVCAESPEFTLRHWSWSLFDLFKGISA